jgi:hypothetical protein
MLSVYDPVHPLLISKVMQYYVLISEEILNHRLSKKMKTIEKDINKKENNVELTEQHLPNKFGHAIIYQVKNQKTIPSPYIVEEDITQNQKEIIKTVREIASYYINLHMDMISTYNMIYSNLLKDIFDSSLDYIPTDKKVTHSMFYDTNRYASSIKNTGNSQKFLDSIINKNLNTFIKSIEITQSFYQDIIQSYLDCVKKTDCS